MIKSAPPAPPASAEVEGPNTEAPPLVIIGQYIKDLSFEIPGAPQIFTKLSTQPEISLDLNLGAGKVADQTYEVTIIVNAQAKVEETTAFILELKYCAIARVNLPEERIKQTVLIDVPALIFPFARNIVSDITRDGGFPPLLLQPVDFVSLFRRMSENEGQSNAGHA